MGKAYTMPRVARRSTSMFRSRYTALAPPVEDNFDVLSMALASESLATM
jgi:hypothetical protein